MRITKLARNLRRNATESEKNLWPLLRNRNLNGLKFLRQHPIYISQIENIKVFFIADFFCDEKKLVVELDGGYHSTLEQKEYDFIRDQLIHAKGYSVLRIENSNNKFKMLRQILDFVESN
jgi:uroporphyrinogen-III synthase